MSASEKFEIQKTDAEWQAELSPESYRVLRKEGTERAGTRFTIPACTPVQAAAQNCLNPIPSSTAAPDGPVSSNPWMAQWKPESMGRCS
jgi:peptide-methionine (R)-S-oxide reductase